MVIFILYRLLFYLLGIILTTIGLVYFIIYISLFSMGFSLLEYLEVTLSRFEAYLLPIGIIIIVFSIYFDNGWNKFVRRNKDR
ncbi:MAG: hypothetical protein PUA56_01775 [Bacillales bacterium]|nr:hypothetical protein [Bacillales bacterium]